MSQKKILMKPQTGVKGKPATEAKQKESLPTKVIVRRLPPSITKETFLEEVSPLPEHDYFHFEPADRSLGLFALCRAVINFKNVEDLYIFKEKFDGYVFVDSRGTEYPAVVEYAPYQKIPLNSRRDHRENTIDDDPEYKKFLEAHENPEAPEPTLSLKEVLEQMDAKQKERIAAHNSETPLLAFINKFKLEKKRAQEKLKEERRLRDLERKRIKDEERRKRERREADDKHNKANTKSSDGDRRDMKKTNKPGAKAGGTYTSYNADTKSPEKSVKSASVSSQKSNKDEIIVRTLPSAKSKNAKQATTDKRPGSGKSAQATSKSNPLPKAANGKPSANKDGVKSDNVSPQTVLSGKQEVAFKSGSSKYDKSEVTVRSIERKSTEKGSSRYSKTRGTDPDTIKGASKQSGASKTEDSGRGDELSERLGSAKLKDKSRGGEGGISSKTSEKLERSNSATSSTSDSRSLDSSEGDVDRPRTARSTRYKDRPERAIYNPAARAAERRQRQQATTSKTSANEESKPE